MTVTRKLSLPACLVIAGLGLLFPATQPARAADLTKEVATADQHAGFAAAAKDLKTAQMHLQHVVNCLVGPSGKGYDATMLNPCKAFGDGIIPETKDPAKSQALLVAVDRAQAGLKENELATAQKAATDVSGILKKQ